MTVNNSVLFRRQLELHLTLTVMSQMVHMVEHNARQIQWTKLKSREAHMTIRCPLIELNSIRQFYGILNNNDMAGVIKSKLTLMQSLRHSVDSMQVIRRSRTSIIADTSRWYSNRSTKLPRDFKKSTIYTDTDQHTYTLMVWLSGDLMNWWSQ